MLPNRENVQQEEQTPAHRIYIILFCQAQGATIEARAGIQKGLMRGGANDTECSIYFETVLVLRPGLFAYETVGRPDSCCLFRAAALIARISPLQASDKRSRVLCMAAMVVSPLWPWLVGIVIEHFLRGTD